MSGRFAAKATAEELLGYKRFIFDLWNIEIRPGVIVTYLEGVLKHVGQTALHFGRGWKYFVAPWGRRCGKTFAAAAEAIYTLALPGTRTWIVAPTYGGTDKVFQIVYQAIVIDGIFDDLGLRVVRATFSKEARYIRLSNGSEIVGKTAESPKSLKGDQLDLLIIDECAFLTEDIFTEYLAPCLLDRDGRVLFISTPRGTGWFKLYFERRNVESTREKGWAGIHCTSYANPYLEKTEIDAIRDETPEDTFQREYMASFVHFTGLIYPMFRNSYVDLEEPHLGGHIYAPHVISLPEIVTRYRSIDIGFRHPTVCLWGAVEKNGNVWIYREYYGEPSTTHDEHSKVIKILTGKERICDTFISHDSRKQAGMSNDDDQTIQERYEANGVFTELANTAVKDGIATVGTYMKSTLRTSGTLPSLFISSACVKLREEIPDYIWKQSRVQNTSQPEEPRKINDHGCDSLRYMLHSNVCYVAPHMMQEERAMLTDDFVRYGYGDSRAKTLALQRKAGSRRSIRYRIMGR